MHCWCQSTQDYQWPHFAHLLTLWLTPSFLHAQIDTWCRGRQTGGLTAPRLQRCGPAVSRLIQSNLPLSQAGTPGCSPSSSRLEAQQTTQPSWMLHTAGPGMGNALLVKSVLTVPHKSSGTMWQQELQKRNATVREKKTTGYWQNIYGIHCIIQNTSVWQETSTVGVLWRLMMMFVAATKELQWI